MSATTREPIVLPAAVYDSLELSALAFGGIGLGTFGIRDERGEVVEPCCLFGHARFVDGRMGEVECAFLDKHFSAMENDEIVDAAMCDGVASRNGRISWDEYCRRANIVRGDA